MVKMGNLSSEILLLDCFICYQIQQIQVVLVYFGIIMCFDNLFYVENSIDGVLLVNELDFVQDFYEILCEVDWVIIVNGYVIISGFNFFSLIGMVCFLLIKWGNVLYLVWFFLVGCIKDWL